MNKAFCKKRVFLSFLLTGCLILFNISCGLDTFYELNAPPDTIKKPDLGNDDSENYFRFFSAPLPDSTVPVTFLGTAVYYKIYKDVEKLKSDVNNLQALADKEEYSYTAAENLVKDYSSLRSSDYPNNEVLISNQYPNKIVYIRLYDFTLYPAEIIIDNNKIGIPLRVNSGDGNKDFNFKASNTDTLPASGEKDVNTTGSGSDDCWYVSLFAVAVANSLDYSSRMYSNILYLGAVKIPVQE